MQDLEKINNELESLNNKLEDLIINFKYLLDHQNIRDINTLNFHFEVKNILNQIDYLEKIKFNLEF